MSALASSYDAAVAFASCAGRHRNRAQGLNALVLVVRHQMSMPSSLSNILFWFQLFKTTTDGTHDRRRNFEKLKYTEVDDNHYLLDCRRHPQCSCSSHTRKRKGENPIEIDRTTYSNIQSSSRCVPHFLLTSIVNSSALNYQEMQCLRSIFPSVRRMRFEKSTA